MHTPELLEALDRFIKRFEATIWTNETSREELSQALNLIYLLFKELAKNAPDSRR